MREMLPRRELCQAPPPQPASLKRFVLRPAVRFAQCGCHGHGTPVSAQKDQTPMRYSSVLLAFQGHLFLRGHL